MRKIFKIIIHYTELWWICINCNHQQKNSNKCEECGGEFLTKGEDHGGSHE